MSEGMEGIPQSAFAPKPPEVLLPTQPVVEPVPNQPTIEPIQPQQTTSVPEAKPTPEIQSQQKDEHPGFFRMALNKVKSMFDKSSQEADLTDNVDNVMQTRMSRRSFLVGAGKTITAASAIATSAPLEAIPHLFAQSERLFLKSIRSIAVEQNENWKTFFQEAEQYKDHEGSMRFVVPEQFAGKSWEKDELSLINNIVKFSKEVVDELYGSPAAWTDNETTIVADDVLGYFGDNTHADAAFLDCDLLTEDILQRKELLSRINLLLLPKSLIKELRDDTLSDAEFSFKAKQISHEIDHANNQYQFPTVILEGLAEMTAFIAHRKLDAEMAAHMEEKYRENITEKTNDPSIIGRTFDEIIKANPLKGESIYNAAGQLMTDWHDKHPDFFKLVRQKENESYRNSGRLPTFDEWKQLGDTVEPGFKNWIESERVLAIPD